VAVKANMAAPRPAAETSGMRRRDAKTLLFSGKELLLSAIAMSPSNHRAWTALSITVTMLALHDRGESINFRQ
jgi:hypothetical protein